MAASKATPPGLPRIRAGMGEAARSSVVEVWTDEAGRRATGLVRLLSPAGKLEGQAPAGLDRAQLPELYRAARRIRALAEQAKPLEEQEKIGVAADVRSREVAIVAAAAALGPGDVIAPGRFESGAALVRGLPVGALVAQLYGNANDLARGRQAPGCASFPRGLNVLPASQFAATQLPHAVGVAWAMKMQRKLQVALAFLDSRETSAEDFHSGLNFAGVYRVPAVFVCITDLSRKAAVPETLSESMAIKSLAYGVPGVRVDGADLCAVFAETRAAAERARRGEGATFIEAVVGGDTGDGLERLAAWLAAEGVLSKAAEAALGAEVDAEVAAAFRDEGRVGRPPRQRMIEDVMLQPSAALEQDLAALDKIRG